MITIALFLATTILAIQAKESKLPFQPFSSGENRSASNASTTYRPTPEPFYEILHLSLDLPARRVGDFKEVGSKPLRTQSSETSALISQEIRDIVPVGVDLPDEQELHNLRVMITSPTNTTKKVDTTTSTRNNQTVADTHTGPSTVSPAVIEPLTSTTATFMPSLLEPLMQNTTTTNAPAMPEPLIFPAKSSTQRANVQTSSGVVVHACFCGILIAIIVYLF
jgi:hypothetical protein